MIQKSKQLFCLLFVVLLVACAGVQMTHKDYMGWAWSIYNTQFEEYKRMVGLGGVPSTDLSKLTDEQKRKSEEAIAGLSEEQRTMLRLKKQVFTDLYPLLKTASSYVDTGKIPPGEIENQINGLIDRLIGAP